MEGTCEQRRPWTLVVRPSRLGFAGHPPVKPEDKPQDEDGGERQGRCGDD
jgi:hypothetical protein